MRSLANDELRNVTGGFSVLGAISIAAIIVFLSGVLNGFTDPAVDSSG